MSNHDSVANASAVLSANQVGRGWRKSSYSAADGCCLEMIHWDGGVAVRDSKDPEGGSILHFSAEAWGHFIGAVKIGGFDR